MRLKFKNNKILRKQKTLLKNLTISNEILLFIVSTKNVHISYFYVSYKRYHSGGNHLSISLCVSLRYVACNSTATSPS